MRWWPTPSSSSASSKPHSNKTFSFGRRAFRSQHQRRLTRSRKLRYSREDDDDNDDPPQSNSSHPLPLPELAVLLRRESALSRKPCLSPVNVPLPSPEQLQSKEGREEREKERSDGDGLTPSSGFGSMFACNDPGKIIEVADTRQSKKNPIELNGAKRIQENYGITMPVSSPTNPITDPALSPKRTTRDILTSPQGIQVLSAMHTLDMNLGLGFSCQMSPEKTDFSVDSSPLHSPRVSPCRRTRSPNGSASPLHKKLSLDTLITWHDSNAQAKVHPLRTLPLPPGATTPSQETSVPQVSAKPDLLSVTSQWQKGKLIGRGTFGSVYVASNRETGALCAMKEVELCPDDPNSAESIKQLEQEIKVLSQLKHPNIVQYYGSEIIGDRFFIYLEYVHPGSINKYIRDHCGAMTESVVRNFTRHILSGLAYLHSTKTIHRDIKGANLLVDAHGVVKLADFGMAKHLTGPAANLSLKGSPYWMAPELLQSGMLKDASSDLALAVDIWSLGCTIIEMLNGKPPWSDYEGPAAMFKVLRETPPIPETLSSEGKDFLRCCFRRNPAERPTANVLLEHRFLKNSQQPDDVTTCTQALNGMILTDKSLSSREHPGRKLDKLLVSL